MPDLSRSDVLAVLEGLLDDRIAACLKPTERHPGPCKGWRGVHITKAIPRARKQKLADALVPHGGRDFRQANAQEVATLREGFEGTFGGLTTTLLPHTVKTHPSSGRLQFIGKILDPATGKEVGGFSREIYEDPFTGRHAIHKILKLKTDYQGQGFAKAFNAHVFDWYREHGVEMVHLHADIDVGGIAWAREGYDWETPGDAEIIAGRINDVHQLAAGLPWQWEEEDRPKWERIPADRLREQLALTLPLRDRLTDGKGFGSEDFPTPYEVSELGRWPGAGRDDWWIGKVIMMGSDWNGVTPV